MKYLLGILLAVITAVASAQTHMECHVYQYPEGDTTQKELVLTQIYNYKGKVVHEIVHNYNMFLEDENTMNVWREDGVYEYYYDDDTLLYKIVEFNIDFSIGKPVDSNKIFYYYNEDNSRLVSEQRIRHLKIKLVGKKAGSFRNTYVYKYNSFGKPYQIDGKYGDSTKEYLLYDYQGRLVTDSIKTEGKSKDYCRVSRYEYVRTGYKEYAWMCIEDYPLVMEYVLDDKKRVVEQKSYQHDETVKTPPITMRTKDWSGLMYAYSKDFKLYDQVRTEYDSEGRVARTTYYYGQTHTTTHVFVYSWLPGT